MDIKLANCQFTTVHFDYERNENVLHESKEVTFNLLKFCFFHDKNYLEDKWADAVSQEIEKRIIKQEVDTKPQPDLAEDSSEEVEMEWGLDFIVIIPEDLLEKKQNVMRIQFSVLLEQISIILPKVVNLCAFVCTVAKRPFWTH